MVRLQIGEPAFLGLAAAFLTILTSPVYRQTLKGTILRPRKNFGSQAGNLLLWTGESWLPLDIDTSPTSLTAPGLTNRPNLVRPARILGHPEPGQYWFTTSPFADPAPLAFGNMGRNILAGPHLFNIDFSLIRKFQIKKRLDVEFNASTFNLTHTPWFDRPDTQHTGRRVQPGDESSRHSDTKGET